MNKPKIIVVCGPTATGKTSHAIKLAQEIGGEVISADSRQVYKGINLLSGKVTKKEMAGIPHHLIDVTHPKKQFSVSDFQKLGKKAIEDILSRGKTPIICGGTGFWIKSIVDDVGLPEVKPNLNLRKKLEKESAEKLFSILKKLDPERSENIDAKNKVSLIRAIEICKSIGKVPPINSSLKNKKHNFLQIGIDVSKEILNEKIKKRLIQRFNEGMIEEVQNLNNSPAGREVSWERFEYFGLEYRWIARYLQKKISRAEMEEKLYFDIIHYAKRQMTWFKKDARILWLNDYTEIEKAIKKFLK